MVDLPKVCLGNGVRVGMPRPRGTTQIDTFSDRHTVSLTLETNKQKTNKQATHLLQIPSPFYVLFCFIHAQVFSAH